MKIKKALKQTIAILEKSITSVMIPSHWGLKERLILIEQNWVFTNLKFLFEKCQNDKATVESLQPFFELLDNHWQIIHGIYQLSYNYNSKLPLTKVLFALASDLSKHNFSNKHRLAILMPTLQTYNANLMMDLQDLDNAATAEVDRLQLHHFILDHWDRIINIYDCICYAKEDTVLKHTSAQINVADQMEVEEGELIRENLQAIELNTQEVARVRYHSKESSELYRVIVELYEEDGKANAMEALENLRKYLNMGGMKGGFDGTDNRAGGNAYIGIRRFYDFTKTISPKDLQTILDAGWVQQNSAYTFRIYWAELLQSAMLRPECKFTEAEVKDIEGFINPFFTAEMASTEKEIYPLVEEIKKLRDKIEELSVIIKKCKNRTRHSKSRKLANKKQRKEATQGIDDALKKISQIHEDMSRLREREILCAEQFALRIKNVQNNNPNLKEIKPKIVANAKEALDLLREYLNMDDDGSTEKKAGVNTYIGVRNFYDFTKTISAENLQTILDAAWVEKDKTYTFREYWVELLQSALLRPECKFTETEITDIESFVNSFLECKPIAQLGNREILCVAQFAVSIDNVLHENPKLIEIKPRVVEGEKRSRAGMHASYSYALGKFEKAQLNNKFTRITEMNPDIRNKLKDDFTLSDFLQRLVQSHHVVTALFVEPGINTEHHLELLNALDGGLLRNVMSEPGMIISVLHHLNVSYMVYVQKRILEKLGKPFLASMFPPLDRGNLDLLSKELPEGLFREFFPQPIMSSTKIINLAFIREKLQFKRKSEVELEIAPVVNLEEDKEEESVVPSKKRRLNFEGMDASAKGEEEQPTLRPARF